MEETFTLLPLHLDPATKAISISPSAPSLPSTPALATELTALNTTHRLLLALDTPNAVPPPPVPLNPKRSAAIQKMREQGNASLTRARLSNSSIATPHHQQQAAQIHEAIKLYTYALEMALTRPPWEPAGIVRDEVGVLLSNRAQAQMGLQAWPEGAADAEASVELKPAPGNGKAWWRRGRCLVEMGRWEEAREWVAKAAEVEGGEMGAEMKAMAAEIEAWFKRREEKR